MGDGTAGEGCGGLPHVTAWVGDWRVSMRLCPWEKERPGKWGREQWRGHLGLGTHWRSGTCGVEGAESTFPVWVTEDSTAIHRFSGAATSGRRLMDAPLRCPVGIGEKSSRCVCRVWAQERAARPKRGRWGERLKQGRAPRWEEEELGRR